MKLMINDVKTDITIENYHTYFRRLRGLMFRKEPLFKTGISIKPCNSIHMMFMYQEIDVVMVNADGKVVFLKEQVKRNSIIPPQKNAVETFELPLGTINDYSIKLNDTAKATH